MQIFFYILILQKCTNNASLSIKCKYSNQIPDLTTLSIVII